VALSIFTQDAGKLICVCLCVCKGGGSGSINFYTGCRKTNVCVSVCLRRWLWWQYNLFTGCRKTKVCVSMCL
jgi:hypothetical protein